MPDTPPQPLHEFLAAERRSVGLSQGEVAKRLGLGLSTVARWEQGGAVPTDRNLARAFELYETDLETVPYGAPRKQLELRVGLLEGQVQRLQELVGHLEELTKGSGAQAQPDKRKPPGAEK